MTKLTPYQQYTIELLSYEEVRVLLVILGYVAVVAAIVVVAVMVLHLVFIAGYPSPLYRQRSPGRGWTKRLLAVGTLVGASLLSCSYGIKLMLEINS